MTLPQTVLDHLGVKHGDKVGVALTGTDRVELAAASTGHGLARARGILRRPRRQPVSLQEMQEATESGRVR